MYKNKIQGNRKNIRRTTDLAIELIYNNPGKYIPMGEETKKTKKICQAMAQVSKETKKEFGEGHPGGEEKGLASLEVQSNWTSRDQ